MNGQNWEVLAEVELHRPFDYRVTENYIYYRPNETRNYSGFTNAYTVGDFYRIPKDGGEPELVFDVTDEFSEKYAIYQFMPDGNYIYASYIRAEDQYESQYNDGSGDMMRINILTGEYDFITSE